MIFSCGCGTSISIPLWQYLSASVSELNYLCLQYDYSVSSSNPWIDAVLINGEAVSVKADVETEEDEEEDDNYIGAVIEYDSDNLEGHDDQPEYYDAAD